MIDQRYFERRSKEERRNVSIEKVELGNHPGTVFVVSPQKSVSPLVLIIEPGCDCLFNVCESIIATTILLLELSECFHVLPTD